MLGHRHVRLWTGCHANKGQKRCYERYRYAEAVISFGTAFAREREELTVPPGPTDSYLSDCAT
jgi:hypothetical protein